MTEVTLNTVTARQLPDPLDSDVKEYSFFVDARTLPKIGMKANPRSQHKSKVWKDIERSLLEPGIKFHRLNRGLRIVADSVTKKSNDEYVICYNEKTQGILNGGSTSRKIWEIQKRIPEGKLVKVTVETGLDLKEIIQMAKTDNLADPVPDYTLIAMGGGFDCLKRVTKGFPMEISYRQGDAGIDVRQILSLLSLFNPDFCKTTQKELYTNKKASRLKLPPNSIHHSRRTVLKRFTQNGASFHKFTPELVRDIFEIYDFVHMEIHRQVGDKLLRKKYIQPDARQILWMDRNKIFQGRLPQGFSYPILYGASQFVSGDEKFSWTLPVPHIRAAYRKALPSMLKFIETAAKSEITPDNFAKKPSNLNNWSQMQTFLKDCTD